MPKIQKVSDEDLDNLRASGLTDETIWDNQLRTDENGDPPGLVFPYRDLANHVNCHARIRLHTPWTDREGKVVKYYQKKGTPLRAYFPKASIEKLINGQGHIYITEGEKKALALSQLGLTAIGIGGVWCWKQKGTDDLIDDLAGISWEGRTVYIVFDYDKKPETREQTDKAATRLATAIRGVGAKVFIIDLPPGPDGQKQGVDDYIVANGPEAFRELVPNYLIKIINSPNREIVPFGTPVLSEPAYHGFVGKFLNAVSSYTEATDAGILAHLLPAIGTLIGSGPYVWAGGKQSARVNCVIVGPTNSGRKGTSFSLIELLMEGDGDKDALRTFWKKHRVRGLSSGEGLIKAVADRWEQDENGEKKSVPVDKRLYVIEEEFSKVTANMKREGNILSQILREAYDSGDLVGQRHFCDCS